MKKVIIFCGPTATGKTDMAIQFAKELDGELISADSRQVYKYIPIASNNVGITNGLIDDIPIHLVEYLEPWERTNLYEWSELAYQKIKEVLKNERIPIIVGGTGLYIDSLVKGYDLKTDQTVDWEKRDELENYGVEKLLSMLETDSPELVAGLNESDRNNPRRLIRLLEKSKSNIKKENLGPRYDYEIYYPKYDWEELKNRINTRVEKIFEDGLVKEVINLLDYCKTKDKDISECPVFDVMGVSQILELLDNKIGGNEAIDLIKIAHRQYARRQRTWFENKNRGYKFKLF